jgi:hypothetical protein
MSVLPNKYISLDFSILGVASIIARSLQPNDTVSTLWDRLSSDDKIRTFDRFASALTLLFAARLLDLDGGVLRLSLPGASER